jgi:hypothetical protein
MRNFTSVIILWPAARHVELPSFKIQLSSVIRTTKIDQFNRVSALITNHGTFKTASVMKISGLERKKEESLSKQKSRLLRYPLTGGLANCILQEQHLRPRQPLGQTSPICYALRDKMFIIWSRTVADPLPISVQTSKVVVVMEMTAKYDALRFSVDSGFTSCLSH